MNQRQLAALINPLDTADARAVAARRTITQQPDGTLLVTIVAVDRDWLDQTTTTTDEHVRRWLERWDLA